MSGEDGPETPSAPEAPSPQEPQEQPEPTEPTGRGAGRRAGARDYSRCGSSLVLRCLQVALGR